MAAIQSEVLNDKKLVVKKIKKQIEYASKLDADIACLPERWNIYKGDIKDELEELDDFSNNSISSFANEFGIYIIAGAIWIRSNDKIIITSSLFNPEGERIGLQQKQHLYSFEKEFFEPAKELKLFDTELGKIGILICFDMTFPEAARKLVLKGADILFSPVMIRAEGIENWHSYLKTRALENRIPVIGVNLVGNLPNKNFPGQSMIIDFKKGYISPSKLSIDIGKSNEPDILIKKIDLKYSKKLRKIRLNQRLESDNYLKNNK